MFNKTKYIESLFKDLKSIRSITPRRFGDARTFLKQDTNNNEKYFVQLVSLKLTGESYLHSSLSLSPRFLFLLYHKAEGVDIGIDFTLQSLFVPICMKTKEKK